MRSVQASLRYSNTATGYGLDSQGIELRFPVRAIQILQSGSTDTHNLLLNC
jgi:hypothetical protein